MNSDKLIAELFKLYNYQYFSMLEDVDKYFNKLDNDYDNPINKCKYLILHD